MPIPKTSLADHRIIIEALGNHAVPVLSVLKSKRLVRRGERPSASEVLKCLASLALPAGIAARVKAVNRELPRVEKWITRLTKIQLAPVEAISKKIDSAKDIDALIAVLEKERANYKENNGVQFGIDAAIGILTDGRSSIYSPNWPPTMNLSSGKDIVKADAKGAVAGGVAGFIFGGPGGALAGGAVGGAGNSAGEFIGGLIADLF